MKRRTRSISRSLTAGSIASRKSKIGGRGPMKGIPYACEICARALGAEPANTIVTADGAESCWSWCRSQPTQHARHGRPVKSEMRDLKGVLPARYEDDVLLRSSLFVRESVHSVWDAILVRLVLSVITCSFSSRIGVDACRDRCHSVTVLITLLAMKLAGMSFNLMTLGGIRPPSAGD